MENLEEARVQVFVFIVFLKISTQKKNICAQYLNRVETPPWNLWLGNKFCILCKFG